MLVYAYLNYHNLEVDLVKGIHSSILAIFKNPFVAEEAMAKPEKLGLIISLMNQPIDPPGDPNCRRLGIP